MPMLSHEQIHQLLVGIASMQKVNGDVFAQTAFTSAAASTTATTSRRCTSLPARASPRTCSSSSRA